MKPFGKIGKGVMRRSNNNRFVRQIALPEFGLVGQEKLQAAHVIVVGAGGLGNAVIPFLAAGGVGKITVIDDDCVSISNLARQTSFGYHDVGLFKSEILADKLNTQYQQQIVFPQKTRLTIANFREIVPEADLLIDGSDNFETRYLLADISTDMRMPLISGALGAYEGQICVFAPSQRIGYRDIFPEPSDQQPCAITGVWSPLVGVVGSLMVSEAFKMIAGIGDSLAGKMMLIDSFTNQVQVINIQSDSTLSHSKLSAGKINFNTLMEWKEQEELLLVDVQEQHEHAENNLADLNISVYDLPRCWEAHLENESRKIVFICPNGIRSKIAYEWLKDKISRCYYVNLSEK
ncbi:HesA/MoeB/ThiF family protein [Sphingobacterium pedocola]|uniref:Thiamine biosynthesis protein ThiF n=1 Tax=Sphingobacterium pedocola TaxID=2082722 RepID=A0ABR9T6V6_9SPHI|nr:HesA/MoeB/ThiF family protein [Sphingobacterium pedocola]MBE8721056.1 thiamine biosynthesis protein ThiF [Sphingobacterium pedocola]